MGLDKYRLWCNTEGIWTTNWSETLPTTCPNNNTHDIDETKTSIIETYYDIPPKDSTGKERVQSTARPLGLKTCWTGCGDDPATPVSYGNGTRMIHKHSIGESLTQYLYIDFNCVKNKTFLYEGYIDWKDALNDHVTLEIVPKTVTTEASINTYYNLYDGYLIVPAAGDGTINVTSDLTLGNGGLVGLPYFDYGIPASPGYWNADWNSTTNKFENITAAPLGNGQYNIFTQEVTLDRFVNKINLLGSGFIRIDSDDAENIGHGMRLRITFNTYNDDHNWYFAFKLAMFREKTC